MIFLRILCTLFGLHIFKRNNEVKNKKIFAHRGWPHDNEEENRDEHHPEDHEQILPDWKGRNLLFSCFQNGDNEEVAV